MYSETGMLEACQSIFTHYLSDKHSRPASFKLIQDIDTMLPEIESVITLKSENGGNTVLLEKIKTDLLYIRKDMG
jgi:hypothetical protein